MHMLLISSFFFPTSESPPFIFSSSFIYFCLFNTLIIILHLFPLTTVTTRSTFAFL